MYNISLHTAVLNKFKTNIMGLSDLENLVLYNIVLDEIEYLLLKRLESVLNNYSTPAARST
jgi:hypothetical protein